MPRQETGLLLNYPLHVVLLQLLLVPLLIRYLSKTSQGVKYRGRLCGSEFKNMEESTRSDTVTKAAADVYRLASAQSRACEGPSLISSEASKVLDRNCLGMVPPISPWLLVVDMALCGL